MCRLLVVYVDEFCFRFMFKLFIVPVKQLTRSIFKYCKTVFSACSLCREFCNHGEFWRLSRNDGS